MISSDAGAERRLGKGHFEQARMRLAAEPHLEALAASASGGKLVASEQGASSRPGAASVRKVTHMAALVLECPDTARARSLVRAAARRHGAEIEGDESSIHEGGGGGGAVLILRAEPARLDALVTELEGAGRLLRRSMSARNLTGEFVDLESRLRNLRKVEKRLSDLMAIRTSRLGEVLELERELQSNGEQIEQVIGRMQHIDALAARATVTVELRQPARISAPPPVKADGALSRLRETFAASLGTFLNTGFVLLRLSGFVLAIGLWTVPIALAGWALRRVARRRKDDDPAAWEPGF